MSISHVSEASPPPLLPASFVEVSLRRRTDVESFARMGIHREMLADRERVESLRRAIERTVVPGMRVLEIGAGTGILSVFAARAGAAHVVSVEASPIATVAKQVVADNGLANKIDIVEASSFEYEAAHPADLLITETLGHVGIDEGILELAADARRRLLAAEATIIPRRVVVTAMPVVCPAFRQRYVGFWAEQKDCNLNAVASGAYGAAYATGRAAVGALAAPHAVMTFTVGVDPPPVVAGAATISDVSRGRIDGLLLGFKAELTADTWLQSVHTSSWRPVFLPLEQPLDVGRGATIDLEVLIPAASVRSEPSWSVSLRRQRPTGTSVAYP